MKSIAFRTNREAIWRGVVPEKYTRLLPHVSGSRVVEMGSAEGVLSLLMAESGRDVIGCDRHKERYDTALQLKDHWRALGRNVQRCSFVNSDIRDRLDLVNDADMLVAVRCIYYLRDEVDALFAKFAERRVRRILLCGNRNRAARYVKANGNPSDKLGKYNFYASIIGMEQALTRAGYHIVTEVTEGDPIVVGQR